MHFVVVEWRICELTNGNDEENQKEQEIFDIFVVKFLTLYDFILNKHRQILLCNFIET